MATTVNSAFNKFMQDFVNLAPERNKKAKDSKDAMIDRINNLTDFLPLYKSQHMQFGSFARKTKIRPIDDKVIYNDHKQLFQFTPLLEWYLAGKPQELFVESNYSMMISLITKAEQWKHEKEWRIFLAERDHQIFADLVSGIIIDERAQIKSNTQKLVALAKRKKWNIRIRKSNLSQTTHIYEPWSEQT